MHMCVCTYDPQSRSSDCRTKFDPHVHPFLFMDNAARLSGTFTLRSALDGWMDGWIAWSRLIESISHKRKKAMFARI